MDITLITGASSGIGLSLAYRAAKEGHNLLLVARNATVLANITLEIKEKFGVHCSYLSEDLSHEGAALRIFTYTKENGWNVSILINNAGIGALGDFTAISWEKHQELIQLNLVSLSEMCHLFLPEMRTRKKGKILNTASTAGFLPGPLQATYFASKAFVLSLSNALHQENKRFGISVTALCPGPVNTQFEQRAGMEGIDAFKYAASPDFIAQKGFNALMNGKKVVIPEVLFRFLIGISRFIPLSLKLRLIEKMQTK